MANDVQAPTGVPVGEVGRLGSLSESRSIKRHLANGDSQQDSHSTSQTSSPLPSIDSTVSEVTSPHTSPHSPSKRAYTDSDKEDRAKFTMLRSSPTMKPLPHYNPSQLLNPKSFKRTPAPGLIEDNTLSTGMADTKAVSAPSIQPQFVFDSPVPVDGEQPLDEGPVSGLGGFIERVHNVSKREDRPAKKQKIKHEDEVDVDHVSTSSFAGGSKGSEIAEYMRGKRKEGLEESGPTPIVVDLTAGKRSYSDLSTTLLTLTTR